METKKKSEFFKFLVKDKSQLEDSVNTKEFNVYINEQSYIIISSQNQVKIDKQLIIDRESGNIKEQNYDSELIDIFKKPLKIISAVLGLIKIFDHTFLVVLDNLIPHAQLDGHNIYRLGNTSYLPMDVPYSPIQFHHISFSKDPVLIKKRGCKPHIKQYVKALRKLLQTGFYFSYTYDLTLSAQLYNQPKKPKTRQHFQWNAGLAKQIPNEWIFPIIQGYIGLFSVFVIGKKLDFVLISRRSWIKGGTRFIDRGVNDKGNVANFAESEQIIIYNNFLSSMVQLRGSVPSFWQQRNYNMKLEILRSLEMTSQAFMNHVNYVYKHYGNCLAVNLLSIKKSGENRLIQNFEKLIKLNNPKCLRYKYIDFHTVCKGKQLELLNPLIQQLAGLAQSFKFFAMDMKSKNVKLKQKGVFRSNCLDCLDRTNVFQSKTALMHFVLVMKHLNVDIREVFKGDPLDLFHQKSHDKLHPFFQNFKHVWGDNGDMISKHYSGTGSTHTQAFKKGKHNISTFLSAGKVSVTRFFTGNWLDFGRQEVLDMLVGQHHNSEDRFDQKLEKLLCKHIKEFTTIEHLTMFISTWNIGGQSRKDIKNFEALLNFDSKKKKSKEDPDILVFGFQEFQNLHLKGMVKGFIQDPKAKRRKWKEYLEKQVSFNITQEYHFLYDDSLTGLYICIFVSDKLKSRVSNVQGDYIKVGGIGKLKMGNKGALVTRFNIDNSEVTLLNCHLKSGKEEKENRMKELAKIHARAFQYNTGLGQTKSTGIESSDFKFLFGDLNFRNSFKRDEIDKEIEVYKSHRYCQNINESQRVMMKIQNADQLITFKKADKVSFLKSYEEGPIDFLPTYKFNKGTDIYDTSKKQRVPSWTDRILYSHQQKEKCVEQLFYKSVDIRTSDHRPVTSLFCIGVKKVNLQKQAQIAKKIYQESKELQSMMDRDKFEEVIDQYKCC